jgi:hypothetical protein
MSLRSVNLISLLLAAVTLLWAMMILGLDALNTGVEAFDLDLNGVTALIFWATAVRFVSLAGWRGPLTGLRVADATSASLQARAIATIGQWVIPVVMGIVWDLDGLVVGVAISAAIGAGLIWQSFYRLELPPKRQTPTGVITNAS